MGTELAGQLAAGLNAATGTSNYTAASVQSDFASISANAASDLAILVAYIATLKNPGS